MSGISHENRYLFLCLVRKAAFSPFVYLYRGQPYQINVGEVVVNTGFWELEMGLKTRKKVRNFVRSFVAHSLIVVRPFHGASKNRGPFIITILDYDSFSALMESNKKPFLENEGPILGSLLTHSMDTIYKKNKELIKINNQFKFSSEPKSDDLAYEPKNEFQKWLISVWPDLKNQLDLESSWRAAFPGVDIEAECKKAFAWEQANPDKKKTRHARFLNNWLMRVQDRSGGSPNAPNPQPPKGMAMSTVPSNDEWSSLLQKQGGVR